MSKWYKKGLRFQCTECGQCCTGAPGYIWVNEEEILEISTRLNLEPQEFADRYLRRVRGRWSIRELPGSNACPFLKGKRCEIYSVRPKQCRTFPWWQENLRNEASWKEAASRCEGISDDAPLVSFEEIESYL